jgi:hypothetical protein
MPESDTYQTLSHFEPRVNELFKVPLEDGGFYPLTLFQASALPPSKNQNIRREPFELRFRGPGPRYLTQKIHRLENPALGPMEIFLVTIGQEGGEFIYQAIFN